MQTIFLLFWLWHLILLSWHIIFLVSFATFCHHHNCSSFNISWHSWKGPIYWCSFGSSLVSLEVFSAAQILLIVQTQLYVTRFFLSPLFLFFFHFGIQKLFLSVLSVVSIFFSALYLVFFSNLLSFHFSFPITLSCLLLPCSVIIQSVFFYPSSF